MIDNAAQVERLLTRLTAALPLPARVTPELAATLQAQSATSEIPRKRHGADALRHGVSP